MWMARRRVLCVRFFSTRGLLSHSRCPGNCCRRVYWQNGYVDIIRSDVILRRRMSGDKVIPFVVKKEVPELDYPEDIEKLNSWIRRMA